MTTFSEIKIQVLNNFQQNARKVDELRNFDEFLLEHIITLVKTFCDQATIPSAKASLEKLLQSVSNIKSNSSLKENYRTINNQCVVLLVSYFGSTIGELFRKGFALALEKNRADTFGSSVLKLTVDEIKSLDTGKGNINLGDVYIKQRNINLQDMKSVVEVFDNCFKSRMDKDEVVNNIIVGQACRNGIVHSGELVDDRLMSQVAGALPRALKKELAIDSQISFEKDEIDLLVRNMNQFLEVLMTKMEAFFAA
jgi:hypothetical protein